MNIYRADLHIHSLLSPCGDLEMSPANIITKASEKGLDIIGITDHNTTRQCSLIESLGEKAGLLVIPGAEVTTKEEVHCLVFFENSEKLKELQEFLDAHLPDIPNEPDLFGDQVVVDEDENIIYTETRMLNNATDVSLEMLEDFVHEKKGIFIPAHIDRKKNSIFSQLGLLPDNLKADALEISFRCNPDQFLSEHPEVSCYPVVTNSDAHFPSDIGRAINQLLMEKPLFSEFLKAIKGREGRRIVR